MKSRKILFIFSTTNEIPEGRSRRGRTVVTVTVVLSCSPTVEEARIRWTVPTCGFAGCSLLLRTQAQGTSWTCLHLRQDRPRSQLQVGCPPCRRLPVRQINRKFEAAGNRKPLTGSTDEVFLFATTKSLRDLNV